MNWEPMTEDAVFEEGEWLLIAAKLGYDYETVCYDMDDDSFITDESFYVRGQITHFCRITNPNEVEP